MAINYKKIGIKTLGNAVGVAGGGMILKALPASINNMWKGLIALFAGAALPEFVKGELTDGIGNGLVSVGIIKLASEFKIDIGVAGIGEVEYSASARNNAIEQANQQVAEYIAAANELEQEISGAQEEANMVAGPDDENMVAEDLAYAM